MPPADQWKKFLAIAAVFQHNFSHNHSILIRFRTMTKYQGARQITSTTLQRRGLLRVKIRTRHRTSYLGRVFVKNKGKAADHSLDTLSKLSDILFLAWQYGCDLKKTSPGSLKYVFRSWIVNADTLAILNQALQNANVAPPRPWPGQEFSMSTEEGKALLGSPNGIAIGWMLVDRQTTFPGKTVTKVTVFENDQGDPSMVFTIGDLS